MLKIRLQRVGRKNIPSFRIVLTDSKNSTKSGKYKEMLGSFDPINDVKSVDETRVKYWLSQGAKPTDTLFNFFIDKNIIEGKKVNTLPKKKPIAKSAANKEETKATGTVAASGAVSEPAEEQSKDGTNEKTEKKE